MLKPDLSTQPFISLIVPVLNEEKDIVKFLTQLKKVKYSNKEIIVADGGSTDQTVALAKKFTDKVYDRQGGKNKSIAENRNKGASLASGEILFFMDCRVRINNLNIFVEQVLKKFREDQELVGLTTKISFYPGEETLLDKIILGLMNFGFIFFNKMKMGTAIGWVQVVRSEAFKKIGGYDEGLITTEDNDLFRRLSQIGQTTCLKNIIAYKSGKRYHQGGWLKAIRLWLINSLWYLFTGKSYSKKWEEAPK